MVNDFDHIFVINPLKNYKFDSLFTFCDRLDFPKSQIYFFGTNKSFKYYFRANFLPYFYTIKIGDFLNRYSEMLNLVGSYYVIIQKSNEVIDVLHDFGIYFQYINIIEITTSIYGNGKNQDYVFDFLLSKGFIAKKINIINHFQNKSLWQKLIKR